MIHSHFSSSFNQTIDNQNSNKLIKLKTNAKKRKKDNVTPQIYVENLRRDKKTMGLLPIEKLLYEE